MSRESTTVAVAAPGFYQIARGDLVRLIERDEGEDYQVVTAAGQIVPVPGHYPLFSLPVQIAAAVARLVDLSDEDGGDEVFFEVGDVQIAKARAMTMLADAAKKGDEGVADVLDLIESVTGDRPDVDGEIDEGAGEVDDPFGDIPPMEESGEGAGEQGDEIERHDDVAFDDASPEVVKRRNDALDKLDALAGVLDDDAEIEVGARDPKPFPLAFVREQIESPDDEPGFDLFCAAVEKLYSESFEGAPEPIAADAAARVQARKPVDVVKKAIAFASDERWLTWYERGEVAEHAGGRAEVMVAITKRRGEINAGKGDVMHASSKAPSFPVKPTHDPTEKKTSEPEKAPAALTNPSPDDVKALAAAEQANAAAEKKPSEPAPDDDAEQSAPPEQATIPAVDDADTKKARSILTEKGAIVTPFDGDAFAASDIDGRLAIARATFDRGSLALIAEHEAATARIRSDVDQQVGYLDEIDAALKEAPKTKKAKLSALYLKKRVKARPGIAGLIYLLQSGLKPPVVGEPSKAAPAASPGGADTSSPDVSEPAAATPEKGNASESPASTPESQAPAADVARSEHDEIVANLLDTVKSCREHVDTVTDPAVFDAAIEVEQAREKPRGSLIAILNRGKAKLVESLSPAEPAAPAKPEPARAEPSAEQIAAAAAAPEKNAGKLIEPAPAAPSKEERAESAAQKRAGEVVAFPGQKHDDAPDVTSQVAGSAADLGAVADEVEPEIDERLKSQIGNVDNFDEFAARLKRELDGAIERGPIVVAEHADEEALKRAQAARARRAGPGVVLDDFVDDLFEGFDLTAGRRAVLVEKIAAAFGQRGRLSPGVDTVAESIRLAKASGDPKSRVAAAVAADIGEDAGDVLSKIDAIDDCFGEIGTALAAARSLGIRVKIVFST